MYNEPKTNPAKEWAVGLIILVVMIGAGAYALVQGGKLLVAGFEYALDRSETAECLKWQDWEMVYPRWDEERRVGYYITQWQKDQCDAQGVELKAHVLNYKDQ